MTAELTMPTVETVEGLETEELILNMGPQHPSTHGVLRLVLKLSGEKVVECIPVMGYLHRGIEKLFEWRTYHQGIRYADQADYVSNMLQEHSYAGAMEAIAGIDVPRRAEYLRVIVDEMSRCASTSSGSARTAWTSARRRPSSGASATVRRSSTCSRRSAAHA